MCVYEHNFVMSMQHTPAKVNTKERMADLKVLIHLRGQAKAKVTRIREAVEDSAGAGVIRHDAAQLKVFARIWRAITRNIWASWDRRARSRIP